MKRTLLLFAMAAIVAAGGRAERAHAGDAARLGTSGAQELRIPVGPRGTALSGAATADASGVEALYWNPAGIARSSGTEAMFSTTSYLVDSRVHYLGLTQEMGKYGTIGVAVKAVALGDIEVTTEEVGGPTGETFSPSLTVIGVSAGRRLSDRVAFGVTANLVTESIRNERAAGVAFDLGFQYQPGPRGFRFGAVMKSFGPKMRFTGSDFRFATDIPDADPSSTPRSVVTESAAFDLPSSFQVGVTYDALDDENGRLRVLSAFQSNTFASDAFRFGAEYEWRGQLIARGGATTAESDHDAWGVTYGGGVRAMLGETAVLIDYTRQSTSAFFAEQNLVSLTLRF